MSQLTRVSPRALYELIACGLYRGGSQSEVWSFPRQASTALARRTWRDQDRGSGGRLQLPSMETWESDVHVMNHNPERTLRPASTRAAHDRSRKSLSFPRVIQDPPSQLRRKLATASGTPAARRIRPATFTLSLMRGHIHRRY